MYEKYYHLINFNCFKYNQIKIYINKFIIFYSLYLKKLKKRKKKERKRKKALYINKNKYK